MTNRLKELRRNRGITVDDIIKQIGICRRTYYAYENGECAIPSDKLCRFADLYGSSADYILGRKNYTYTTLTDNEGLVLDNIGGEEIVEHKNVKAILN